MTGGRKRCQVAWAGEAAQRLLEVEVPDGATVADVLDAARALSGDETVPWREAPVGIFGEVCDRATVPHEGDRIELYRPLRIDPKEARRSRARRPGGG